MTGSKWANPFRVRDCTSLHECISRFDTHLHGSPRLIADLEELSGKCLLCHCSEGAPCHGDALISAFASQVLSSPVEVVTLMNGIYHDPEDFIKQAVKITHPFHHHALSDGMRRGLMVRMQCSEHA